MADTKKASKRTQSRSAAKTFRQSEQARLRHKARRNMISTMEKKFRAAVEAKDEAAVQDLLSKQFAILDKAVKGGTFHKNKANRKKSRLALLVKSMKTTEVKAEVAAEAKAE